MYSVKNGCGIFDLEHTMIKHYYNTYIFHYNASTSVVINKKKRTNKELVFINCESAELTF